MPLAQLISTEQLQQRLGQENLLILDCRFALEDPAYGRRSYLDGHIPGAHFLDLEQDLSAPVVKGVTGRHPLPDPSALVERLRSCGLKVQVVLTKSDKLSKNAAMSQKALFKREMSLKEHEIITYSSSQHTMRGELIERIMNALSANGVEQE